MKRPFLVQFAMIPVICALGAQAAAAQDTRAEAVSMERAAKAEAVPEVHQPGMFQRTVKWAGSRLTAESGEAKDGWYAQLGEMIPGAGWLAAGPGYRHHLFGDAAVANVSAAMSWRRYVTMQSRIEWPTLWSNHLTVGAGAKYQDFTQVNYFGVGPDTDESAQTDYRLRNIDVTGHATVRPADWLSIGGNAGYIGGLAITPGASAIYRPTQDLFDNTTAPGLTVQPRYGHAEVFAEADSRDLQGYPSSGGLYRVGLTTFRDLDASGQSFHRIDADATQYLPLFHRNWIVSVRGHVAMTQTAAGNEVPFYLLPTLGSRSTLRGYADYRFRDRNAASLGAEYRWPVFRMMDAALFADAGSVAPTASGLLRERLYSDYGFGVRFHTATRPFARIDIARGGEGTRVSLSLSKSLGNSGRKTVIPYVP